MLLFLDFREPLTQDLCLFDGVGFALPAPDVEGSLFVNRPFALKWFQEFHVRVPTEWPVVRPRAIARATADNRGNNHAAANRRSHLGPSEVCWSGAGLFGLFLFCVLFLGGPIEP